MVPSITGALPMLSALPTLRYPLSLLAAGLWFAACATATAPEDSSQPPERPPSREVPSPDTLDDVEDTAQQPDVPDTSEETDTQDSLDAEDVAPEVDDPGPTLSGFDEPCDQGTDCLSGFCLVDDAHTDRGRCTATCSSSSPCTDAWSCADADALPLPWQVDFSPASEPPDAPDGLCIPPDEGPCPGSCEPGTQETDATPCGACNEGQRARTRTCSETCSWGPWTPSEDCQTSATCAPDERQTGIGACDTCPGAIRERERVCNPQTCQWDAFGAWSACGESGTCAAGSVDVERRSCGCGEETRSRTCVDGGCGWGQWTPWSGCSDTLCTPGATETESESCGPCPGGTRERVRTCASSGCEWGTWSDWGACSATTLCTPGATETRQEPCGTCGGGTRTESRMCATDGCGWGEWQETSGCSTTDTCTPGEVDVETEDCSCLGQSRRRERTCQASCTWGNWSAWDGACPTPECTPGDVRTEGCDRCAESRCSDTCTWSECALRAGAACEHRSGTNWRCCGESQWQFCLPDTCQWSSQCETCSPCLACQNWTP